MPPRAAAFLPILCLVVATALWGALFCVAKLLTAELTPFDATFARFFFAAIPLVALSWREWKHLRREDVPLLLAVGALSSVLFNAFMFFGVRLAPASDAVLAPASSPVLVALLGALCFGDRIGRRQGLGLAVSIGGLAWVFSGNFQAAGGGLRLLGDALLLGCALFWSGYIRLSSLAARRYSPLALATATAVVGAVSSLPIVLAEGSLGRFAQLSLTGWGQVGYISLIGSVAAFWLWGQGAAHVGPARAGLFMNLVPIWILVTASGLLGEALAPYQIAGIGIVLAGMWIASRPAPARAVEGEGEGEGGCRAPLAAPSPSFGRIR